MDDKLRFKIAPHLVQDLGLNLYTSVGKVLVEFVANAYDADSASVDIQMNFGKIEAARAKMAIDWKQEQEAAKIAGADVVAPPGAPPIPPPTPRPLSQRIMPPELTIEITDYGRGMSRGEIQERYLVAGRRRREEDPESAWSRPFR